MSIRNDILKEVAEFMIKHKLSRYALSKGITHGADHTVIYRLERGKPMLDSTLTLIQNYMRHYDGKRH